MPAICVVGKLCDDIYMVLDNIPNVRITSVAQKEQEIAESLIIPGKYDPNDLVKCSDYTYEEMLREIKLLITPAAGNVFLYEDAIMREKKDGEILIINDSTNITAEYLSKKYLATIFTSTGYFEDDLLLITNLI